MSTLGLNNIETQEFVGTDKDLVRTILLNAQYPLSRAQLLSSTSLSVDELRAALKLLVKEGEVVVSGAKKGTKYSSSMVVHHD